MDSLTEIDTFTCPFSLLCRKKLSGRGHGLLVLLFQCPMDQCSFFALRVSLFVFLLPLCLVFSSVGLSEPSVVSAFVHDVICDAAWQASSFIVLFVFDILGQESVIPSMSHSSLQLLQKFLASQANT